MPNETAIGIFPIGEDDEGNKFWASQGAPSADGFLESIVPLTTLYSVEHELKWSWIKIDTTSTGCKITVTPSVTTASNDVRGFSGWRRGGPYDPETGTYVPVIFSYDQTLEVKAGDEGWFLPVYDSSVFLSHIRLARPWGPTWIMRRLYALFRRLLVPPRPPRPEEKLGRQLQAIIAKLPNRPMEMTKPIEAEVLTEV